MTKEMYLTMCEQLGNEPELSEIPVEVEDLPLEAQQALLAYRMLRDEWEGFNGLYLGKSLVGLTEILDFIECDQQDRKLIVTLIQTIDAIRGNLINEKQKKPAK
jgi:hypothetical protein